MCSFLEIEGDGRLARGRHGDECVVLTSDEVFFRLMLHCEKGFEGLVFQLEGVLLTAVRQRLADRPYSEPNRDQGGGKGKEGDIGNANVALKMDSRSRWG